MEEDDSILNAANNLQTLISALSSSTTNLSNRSRAIPTDKDFHFFNNFPEFKFPINQIQSQSESALQTLASSTSLFGSKTPSPLPDDLDDSYDWLVGVNDELLEKFHASMDEFRTSREKQEGKVGSLTDDGFQMVYGKNRNRRKKEESRESPGPSVAAGVSIGSKETRERSKVPFHIPTIPRPQDQFNILANNSNQPFEHELLERSEDGSRFVHPLEKLSASDFVDRSIAESEMVKPLPLESTPFKLVEGVKELKELASKLRDADEFAVDLEHNHYRSFQGLTCLMQISTRTEDFIVDTLKLRANVGPCLREVFKDPSKRKVMHGADRDIEWLQRDFGIYVCNLFDTGQASRMLQLERNSLEYLLNHFCGVHANKEYQNADWRLRPLPAEMLKYAREDTHYLLHIYDLMRQRLLSASADENDLLLEVYNRSYDICIHLYEKELLTDASFLHIYGLQDADFDSKQLAIVYGLHGWRDKVAREEDESTGYILPNKTLLEIARQMPVSPGKLRRLVRSKYNFVERHLNNVISIIKSSIENSSSFETIAEELKQSAQSRSAKQNKDDVAHNSEMHATEDPMDVTSSADVSDVITTNGDIMHIEASTDGRVSYAITQVTSEQIISAGRHQQNGELQSVLSSETQQPFQMLGTTETAPIEKIGDGNIEQMIPIKKVSTVSVQVSKKPSSGFGALFGKSGPKRKINPAKSSLAEDDGVSKVELIKSSVTLPFFSFSSQDNPLDHAKVSKHSESETAQQLSEPSFETPKLEDVIMLETDKTDSPESPSETPMDDEDATENGNHISSQPEEKTALMSLNERKSGSRKAQTEARKPEPKLEIEPFDYEAARKELESGGSKKCENRDKSSESGGKKKVSAKGRDGGEERVKGLRRQAFPPSGNRSVTYK